MFIEPYLNEKPISHLNVLHVHFRHVYQSTIILLDKQSQTYCVKENHERIFFSNTSRLNKDERDQAIGMLAAGQTVLAVSRFSGCTK